MESEQIMELITEIKRLNLQVEKLEQKVENANIILIEHIGFINSVFYAIKKPLFFIMDKINNNLLLNNG